MAKNNRFGRTSEQRLIGVHPDLVKVVRRALEVSTGDFSVLEGVRTIARQKQLNKKRVNGKKVSWTLRSRHLTGHAVDLIPYPFTKNPDTWLELDRFDEITRAMKQASDELNIPIECGRDWKSRDCPHYQLPRKDYPA